MGTAKVTFGRIAVGLYKYKGHRMIPAFVIADLQKEYEENCKKKEKARKFN